jgi:NADP-dependent 3-hydroxy acid dehydrogenase YdfG
MSKVVLITGSSSGIGRITAALFASRGWNVAATARRVETIETTQNVKAFRLDVTDESSVEAAVAATLNEFGTIDVLVNNAGYGLFGPLEGASEGQLEALFRTNVLGLACVTRHVLPVMRERKSGTIVNVSSIAGRVATPFMSGYHATKFAVEGLSESLRYELSLHGIRVKLVEPAHFKTDFMERSLQRTSHPAYAAAFDNFMGWVRKEDAKAPGPQPVAEAIYRAATDRSERLRYPVGGKVILALTSLFPDAVWRYLNAAGMTRPSK